MVTQTKLTRHPFEVAGPGGIVSAGSLAEAMEIQNEVAGQRAGDLHYNVSLGAAGWGGGNEPENLDQVLFDGTGNFRFVTDIFVNPNAPITRFGFRTAGITGGQANITLRLSDESANSADLSGAKPGSADNGIWLYADLNLVGQGLNLGEWICVEISADIGTATGTVELTGVLCQDLPVTSSFPEPGESPASNLVEDYDWKIEYWSGDVDEVANPPTLVEHKGISAADLAQATNDDPTVNISTSGWPNASLPAALIDKAFSPAGAAHGMFKDVAFNITADVPIHIRCMLDYNSFSNGPFLFFLQDGGSNLLALTQWTSERFFININASGVAASPNNAGATIARLLADVTYVPSTGVVTMMLNGEVVSATLAGSPTFVYTGAGAVFGMGCNSVGNASADVNWLFWGLREEAFTEAQHHADLITANITDVDP